MDILDINGDMLAVGRERAKSAVFRPSWISSKPMPRNCLSPTTHFDAYTIAFGIRNVPRRDKALSEAYRVLKRGGRVLCLEFSMVDVPVLDEFYRAWSFGAIPAIGKAVAGDGEPYRYLVESIAEFPSPAIFRNLIAAAGFRRAGFTRLTGASSPFIPLEALRPTCSGDRT